MNGKWRVIQFSIGKVGFRAVNANTTFDNFLVSTAETSRTTYTLGGQAIATRILGDLTATNNGLFYLFSDHLGSTSVLATSNGNQVPGSKTAYYPFGSPRTPPTQTITDRNFTGQKENLELGLLYYNARYYLPGSGRFLTPDTLIPNPANPQTYNRYSYVRNNPLNRIDPSGHVDCDDTGCYAQHGWVANPLIRFTQVDGETWTIEEKRVILQGAATVARQLANTMNQSKSQIAQKYATMGETYNYTSISAENAFLSFYGGAVTFHKTGQSCTEATGATLCYAQTQNSRLIHVFTDIYNSNGESQITDVDTADRWAVHELGHAFESRVNGSVGSWGYVRSQLPDNVLNRNGFAGAFNGWQQSRSDDRREIFADMFIGWAYGQWEISELTGSLTGDANRKAKFMATDMSIWVNIVVQP